MSKPYNTTQQIKKLKPEFTINEIGKLQFYSGILVGIGYSIILNYLFRFTLKVANFGVFINEWKWDYEINTYYYYLIGFTSVGFAFCYTIYIWLSNPFTPNRKIRLRLRMSQTNSIWLLFGTLLFLLRMFWFMAGTPLTIEKDFPLTGFMLPVVIYLFCWNLISTIYKSKKVFLVTTLIFILIGLILSVIN